MKYLSLLLPLSLLLLSGMMGCKNLGEDTSESVDTLSVDAFDAMKQRGELRVLTLNSSVSYFEYKGVEMGADYELARNFALSQGVRMNIIVADNLNSMIEMLHNGEADMIAYNVPIVGAVKEELLFCGMESVSSQVLIQRRHKGWKPIREITQLVGKDIYVEADSKYAERLDHLNAELGGGIHIHWVDKDTLVTEDLIEMVAMNKIPYTLADKALAQLNKTYHNNIDIALEVSFPQRSSWAVRKDSPLLAEAIGSWMTHSDKTAHYKKILKRYFEYSKRPPASKVLSPSQGRISVYDPLFKKYAEELDWDWRLLASQCYHESRFDSLAVSWAGALGLMQLMPATATHLGVEGEQLQNPEINIQAGVKLLKTHQRSLSKIEDEAERTKFVLAAYNAGLGHVFDAMALAEKYGRNSHVWDGHVAEYVLLKSNPEFYNDSICKHGYLRGKETYNYVNEVLLIYDEYKQKIAL